MGQIYLTQQGYDKLLHEMEYLRNVKRREISKRIEEARAMGDLSENAEYDAAKDTQARVEGKIIELQDKLSRAVIISKSEVNLEKVSIGTKVTLKDLNSGSLLDYTIMSDEEADFSRSEIGVSSPIARGLLGKKESDTVEITVPKGILKYQIVKIALP